MGYIEELREIVGSRPLNLAGVAVAVLNDQGQILLQQRRNGMWGVPGGFVELGESTEEDEKYLKKQVLKLVYFS